MMRPPCGAWSFIRRKAAWAQKNIPFRFTATTCSHCAAVSSSKGVPGTLVPALLNSRSSRPNPALRRAKAASTEAGSVTSAGRTRVRAAPQSAAVSSSASRRRPSSATAQPSVASAIAAARPTPEPAPVTSAHFPAMGLSPAIRCSAARVPPGPGAVQAPGGTLA